MRQGTKRWKIWINYRQPLQERHRRHGKTGSSKKRWHTTGEKISNQIKAQKENGDAVLFGIVFQQHKMLWQGSLLGIWPVGVRACAGYELAGLCVRFAPTNK